MLCAALAAAPAAAQGPTVLLRAGVLGSTALAEDGVASALLRAQVGAPVAAAVRARGTPAPHVELAARLPLREGVSGELSAGWARGRLRAEEEGGGAWDVGDLDVLHAMAAVRWAWGPGLGVSAGFGAVRYAAGGQGIFGAGGELNPGVQAALDAGLPWAGGRTGVRVFIQGHRFNTPALRRAGASDGGVLRMGVQGTVRLHGGAR